MRPASGSLHAFGEPFGDFRRLLLGHTLRLSRFWVREQLFQCLDLFTFGQFGEGLGLFVVLFQVKQIAPEGIEVGTNKRA